MATTFHTDVDEYYRAKESYTTLLKQAAAKDRSLGDPLQESPKPKSTPQPYEDVIQALPEAPKWEHPRSKIDLDNLEKAHAILKERKPKGLPNRKK
ncbi:hypothetical protein MMC09_001296 [Bachmanniomyces sp. S44760]|nr:hypothetical protein [Bachmanniomyces sp. S44760]